ncbi:MAG: GntR family transcriptional regulator [Ruminococcaceae bacterium]|nr:GntR family transcriptional regulator [Oscillospiraceae bacterium]
MIHLDYRDARPIHTQIYDGIREQILAGVLQAGDKLPSVREMAARLAINPNTIQRSYRELELQGWIASVPGKGSFVCGVPNRMEPKQAELMKALDKTAEQLLQTGLTRQELIRYLMEGGSSVANTDECDETVR